jgi:hypothetical protein
MGECLSALGENMRCADRSLFLVIVLYAFENGEHLTPWY